MGCSWLGLAGWAEYEVSVIIFCRLTVTVFFATPQSHSCFLVALSYNYRFSRFQKRLSPLAPSGLVMGLLCCYCWNTTPYITCVGPGNPELGSSRNPPNPQQVWPWESLRKRATKALGGHRISVHHLDFNSLNQWLAISISENKYC